MMCLMYFRKRQRLSDSEDDDSDEDDKEDGGDVYRGPPVARYWVLCQR